MAGLKGVFSSGDGGSAELTKKMNLEAPKPVEMPTIDTEAIKQARRRAAARMKAKSSGRDSTMLGGNSDTLGGN